MSGVPAGGGKAGAERHWASSASHSKPGPVPTEPWPARWRRSHATVAFSSRPAGPAPVRHVPWPPQNQISLCGTPFLRRIASLRIDSLSVKSVSAVPWRISVGTRTRSTSASPGPRDSNHARSAALNLPVASPEANEESMCGSSPPPWAFAAGVPAA